MFTGIITDASIAFHAAKAAAPKGKLREDTRRFLAASPSGATAAGQMDGDPYGNRTRVSAVKGPRPNR